MKNSVLDNFPPCPPAHPPPEKCKFIFIVVSLSLSIAEIVSRYRAITGPLSGRGDFSDRSQEQSQSSARWTTARGPVPTDLGSHPSKLLEPVALWTRQPCARAPSWKPALSKGRPKHDHDRFRVCESTLYWKSSKTPCP